MTEEYLLAIDQGTTGTKVLLVDKNSKIIATAYEKHTQFHPKTGWVEHDSMEIWEKVKNCVKSILEEFQLNPKSIKSIGIANQGETVTCWNKTTKAPIEKAIVWSCTRSHEIAANWKLDGDWNERVHKKTGLKIDSYFSASKIKWYMENSEKVKKSIQENTLLFGTLDTWLIWKMTGGQTFKTDSSTASRTLLYNINDKKWDEEILDYLGINKHWLPTISPTVGDFGESDPATFLGIKAPIQVSIVDQPASLFGHLCIDEGESKCTYGTGCFAYVNVGNNRPVLKDSNTLTSIVWEKEGETTFAVDGAVYSAGSSVNWAMEKVGLFESIDELNGWSKNWNLNDAELDQSLLFVPSLGGLGTPYWNTKAKGVWMGMSYSTSKEDLARAILEGIAHRVADTIEILSEETNTTITSLKVDGGLIDNDYLMQFQADLLGIPIVIPESNESTAIGVAFLLGEAVGWWETKDLYKDDSIRKTVHPKMDSKAREGLRERWRKTVALVDGYYGTENE
ncbi:FGGY family carbohydrate kinase [Sporosarcina sp. CAU 1771]